MFAISIQLTRNPCASRHLLGTTPTVTDIAQQGESMNIVYDESPTCASIGSPNSCPSGADTGLARNVMSRVGSGAVDGGAMYLLSRYGFFTGNNAVHAPVFVFKSDAVGDGGAAASVSAGEMRLRWKGSGTSTATNPNFEKAVKNKRGNFVTWLQAVSDGGPTGMPTYLNEITGATWGAIDEDGSNALMIEGRSYVHTASSATPHFSEQLPSETSRRSTLGSGDAVTRRWYDVSTGRLQKMTQSGYTQDLAGSVIGRTIGTFYSDSRTCGASAGPDPLGRTLEVRGPCLVDAGTATGCNGNHPVKIYEYYAASDTSNNKNRLNKVFRYPGGSSGGSINCSSGTPLTTTYVFDGGATLNDRVNEIKIKTYDGGWSATPSTLVSGVAWEPYGELRGYVQHFLVAANTGTVEYALGDNAGSGLGCSGTAPSTSSGYDLTGRLRSLRVTTGTQSMGTNAGSIYQRNYTWRADQISRMNTCYLGGSTELVEDIGYSFQPGYDNAQRLISVDAPNFADAGGWERRHDVDYDARGNRRYIDVAPGAFVPYTYSATSYRPDLLTGEDWSGSPSGHRYSNDRDGRQTARYVADDSSGDAGSSLGFDYNVAGADTVFKSVKVMGGGDPFTNNPAYFNYYYDAFNRRVQKVYPTSIQDEFFYDLGHQLLEDQGNAQLGTANGFPVDEYIWLGGRPVAVIRSSYNYLWVHGADFSGAQSDCNRNDEAGSCDVYALVSDHISKPVLSLDSSRRITGVGEHEPFGALNRVEWWLGTSHPYTTGAEGPIWNDSISQPSLGMNTAYRIHLTMVDTEENCSGVGIEGPSWWDGTTGAMFDATGGYHRGEHYSKWWTPQVNTSTGKSIFRVGWGTYAGNCRPQVGTCCPSSNWQFMGYASRDYEFQRYQSGAQRFFTPLRFPGQYFDEETHLHENWNRFYDPTLGRYLQPEPWQRSPYAALRYAYRGLSLPVYSYALNNPVGFVDADGLGPKKGGQYSFPPKNGPFKNNPPGGWNGSPPPGGPGTSPGVCSESPSGGPKTKYDNPKPKPEPPVPAPPPPSPPDPPPTPPGPPDWPEPDFPPPPDWRGPKPMP